MAILALPNVALAARAPQSAEECRLLFTTSTASPSANIEVSIVRTIQNEGWDNEGVYEVTSPAYPGRRLVAKVTTYQSDFARIAKNNQLLAQTTSLAAQYFGITRINIRGTTHLAYVTEFSAGIVSKDSRVEKYVKPFTMTEAETAFRHLLAAGILPLDFQFMVQPDGHIKVIDADLYVSAQDIRENPVIREGRTTALREAQRLINKITVPSEGDMIWGSDFYSDMPGDIPARSTSLLEEMKSKAQPLLSN